MRLHAVLALADDARGEREQLETLLVHAAVRRVGLHAQLRPLRLEIGVPAHPTYGYQTLFMPISAAADSAARSVLSVKRRRRADRGDDRRGRAA